MIAAFFDLDGTLYRGHIWQELAKRDWAAGTQRRWVAAYVARNMALFPLYRLGMMSQDAFYGAWGETMSWLLRGRAVDECQALFQELAETKILPDLRADVLALLRQHQVQGHLVALVSGTFVPLLEIVAQRLEIPHAIGTELEVRNRRCTGRILAPLCQGPGKPIRIRAYLQERQLAVEWLSSFAYADSGTDLHLLSQVGHPVAVCPDGVLLAHAQKAGWEVVGETDR